MVFLSLRVTTDTEGGLKGPTQMRRSLQGGGGGSHQQASAGYIPAHCLPLPSTASRPQQGFFEWRYPNPSV